MIVKCKVLYTVPASKRILLSLLVGETAVDPRIASGAKTIADLKEGQVCEFSQTVDL